MVSGVADDITLLHDFFQVYAVGNCFLQSTTEEKELNFLQGSISGVNFTYILQADFLK